MASILDEIYRSAGQLDQNNQLFNGLTYGVVVDTNDPKQMGRLRVRCPAWGEGPELEVSRIPWATYITPFGGSTIGAGRGSDPNGNSSINSNGGSVAYGMWAIPKVGAVVHLIVFFWASS